MSGEVAEISVSQIEKILRERKQLQINIDARKALINSLSNHFGGFRLTSRNYNIVPSETSKGLVEEILNRELSMYQERLAEIENKLISISLLMK